MAGCSADAAEDGPDEIAQLLEEHASDADDGDGANGDDEADPDPDPPTDPAPPDDDPFAIPDEIDPTYVDLVMNELLAISSATLRAILSRDPGEGLTEEDSLGIRAAYSGPRLLKAGEDFLRYSNNEESRIGFLPPDELGDIRWETEEILEADDSCIVAIGWYDITQIAIEPYPPDQYAVASLEPAPDDASLQGLNPTPWRLLDLNLMRIGGEPVPREDWDRVSFDATLDIRCDPDGGAP
jgi:hypothetical protein